MKSTVQKGRQAKAPTAWTMGSVCCARESGSGFSHADVGHREIVGPRRTPRMNSESRGPEMTGSVRPVRHAPRRAPEHFALQLEGRDFAELTDTVKEE